MTRRKIIDIDENKCNGCGQCVPACAEGALRIVNGKAKLVADVYCDGLGACLGECHQGAIRIIERDAGQFDEALVENARNNSHAAQSYATPLKLNMAVKSPHPHAVGSRLSLAASHFGCPGMAVKSFLPPKVEKKHGEDNSVQSTKEPSQDKPSELTNWPIQLHLVPPHAPFLHAANLLLAADCVPAAMPNFHGHFLRGRPLLIGCPKLDDTRAYVEKLAAILRVAEPKNLTVVRMEVPCCMGLMRIATEAKTLAQSNISIEEAVVSRRGEVL